ncbi:MAG: VOC family protein [Armatimonadetes bacterium]|nr:VOC family protein [Armatimonadota bacterium]MDE2207137.1 VOC family protein [Armatimonadota bacterium]
MQIEGVIATVMVTDIERAVQFYCDKLGFTIADETCSWVLFAEGVALRTAPEAMPDDAFRMNAVAITLAVTSVEQAWKELTSRGVAFYLAPTMQGGVCVAAFRDSENNVMELIELNGSAA